MWFRQIQIFQLTMPVPTAANKLAERLESLAYKPCLPTMPSSVGWVSPLEADEEELPLVRGINGCLMLCLQMEEKILPASVVGQALKEKIRAIETQEARRVRQKEKLNYRDEIIHTLLPRAFSKLSQLHAYIDTRNNWLILNATSPKKTELFLSMFKKSLGDGICSFEVTKPAAIITQWLRSKEYPTEFSFEKSCVLQDPAQQTRIIRCSQQDLFAGSIQSFVNEGCEAVQTALCWHDRLNFTLADDFSLRSIRLAEDDLAEINDEIETKAQKFDADLVMMSELYAGLVKDLLTVFTKKQDVETIQKYAMTG